MKIKHFCIAGVVVLGFSGCQNTGLKKNQELQGFVFVKGQQFESKGKTINVGDFEILDHPVTNAEYHEFVSATQYVAPLHWKTGKIPSGKEDYPVIFVNRDDAEAYTKWLSKTTGRVHRIPTTYEFELAARGGEMNNDKYFWGNSNDQLSNDNINFNAANDRVFNQWETYLKPAKWGLQNKLGLFQMTGNVWQLVLQNEDPAVSTYKYRIEKIQDVERTIMGGSWMSPKEYFACGNTVGQSPALRYPDLGIRLIREPENAHWTVENRKVIAVSNAPGKITLSWALLDKDKKDTHFNIYRLTGNYRSYSGQKINVEPIFGTSYIDEVNITDGNRYQYRIVSVDHSGNEENPSDWAAITAGEEQYPIVVKYKPILKEGGMTPVFGNIEGYGKLNCVIRLDNGCKEDSQDPGWPVQLEAFSFSGKSLWCKDIAWHENIFGSASNAPFNVWDMNGDGKDEVITLLQVGEDNYVAILDGMSGRVMKKTLWDKMATDYSRSSTRIQMSIAYLDGKTPSIITQTGIYENEIISAFDKNLNHLWTYNSFMETSGSGGHKVEIADVDNDGKQEVIYGTTCLNADGSIRWSIYRQHPDIISIHDYIPERPGLEVCFIVESSGNAGIYMVDANTGEVIWKNNRNDDPVWSHGHSGWTADIWEGSPGMECVTNRAGHADKNFILFSSEGKRIDEQFPSGFSPMEWDGDMTRELIAQNGTFLGNYNGTEIVQIPGEVPNPVPNTSVVFTADLCGDFRSELVISGKDSDGRDAIMVVTAKSLNNKRYVCPSEKMDYRLWLARNKGGGYGSVYEYPLINSEN